MTARPIQIQNFWRVPEIRLGAMVALLLAWCAALLTFRVLWTWKLHYTFLVWNLGLATMPLIFSTIFVHAQRRFISVTAFSLWLLFFPNAPYIITDFTHLQNHSSGPIWFDILLLFSSAAVGLIIGYISLSQVHDRLLTSNHRSLARIVVSVAPFAAAFGIYLGRFLRWRSIDIFHNPLGLFADIAHRFIFPYQHPRTWGVTLGFGMLLALGYSIARLSTRNTWEGESPDEP